MPIGKNAIKRVENNGYSNVASSAPDMENSIVAEPALSEPKAAPAEAAETLPEAKMTSAEPAKRRRGRPVKEKPVKEETAAASPTVGAPKRRTVKAAKNEKNGFERVELGGEMPYWLL